MPAEVLFETGYGPSGLPHIGTFGEVARTTMVRHAFETLSDVPTRLLCFSDDMDGLRKVPDNIPNRDMVARFLGRQLTKVPDPFGKYESFGHHNNAMLRRFLDQYGFEYEFASSTEYYRSGRFDAALRRVLEALRRGARRHAAVAARRTGVELFAVPAHSSEDRRRHAGADRGTPAQFRRPSSGGTRKQPSASRRR